MRKSFDRKDDFPLKALSHLILKKASKDIPELFLVLSELLLLLSIQRDFSKCHKQNYIGSKIPSRK